jgi:antitoxin component YwqK of YwqJK toxin-antitoxin module
MHAIKYFLLVGILVTTTTVLLPAQNVTDSKGLKQGEWRKLDAKGNVIYEGQFKNNIPQGLFKYFYEDGKIRTELNYSEDGKTAKAVNFYPGGKKMAEGSYFETKKDGTWKYYNDLEILSMEEYYQKGMPVGIWKTYYDDGKLLEDCPYLNGLKQGVRKQYFSDGSIKSEVNYDKGKMEGPARYNYPNGNPMLVGQLHDDLKEGLWTAYKDNGDKENEITYTAGEPTNEIYFDRARESELKNEVKEIPVK